MAESRKDNKGRVLRKGETQRSCDGKYVYTYTDPEGKRRSIYSKDIMELRQREEKLIKDQLTDWMRMRRVIRQSTLFLTDIFLRSQNLEERL